MNYAKSLPDREEGQSLTLDVRPIKVLNVDIENGIVQLDLWLTYSWIDRRLQWDPAEYEVDKLYMKTSEIHIPEIVPYYGSVTDLLTDPETVVQYDGMIYYVRPIRAEVYCNLPDIPFQRKLCNMTFGSWSRDASSLNLTTSDEIDMSSFAKKIGTCRIPSASKKVETKVFTCCPASYSSMLVTLHVRCQTKSSRPSGRQALGYHDDETGDHTRDHGGDLGVALEKCPLSLVVAPFMVLLVFLLPPRASDRVFLGAIVFLYLLLIWTSGALTTDEYVSFHQLSIGVTIAATFFSLVACKINGDTSSHHGSANGELNEEKRRWCKKRLASMLDMMMFAAAAMVLGVATAGFLA